MNAHIHNGRLKMASHKSIYENLLADKPIEDEELEPSRDRVRRYFDRVKSACMRYLDRACEDHIRHLQGLAYNLTELTADAEQALKSVRLNQAANPSGIRDFF